MSGEIINNVEKVQLCDKSNGADGDDFVDPWNVVSKSDAGVDYDKLISTYG